MLGPRPDKDQAGKRRRKWEAEEGEDSDREKESEATISAREMEEWREREKLEEQREEHRQVPQQTRPAAELAVVPAAAAAATQPMACYQLALMPPPRTGPGLRLGEGDDTGRSRDEIRIIKEMLAEEIQRFIVDNRIDAPAARDLRVEPVHVQFAVLDRGPLTSCVNPSGALIGRIRDAKKGVRHGTGAPTAIHQSLQMPLPPGASMPPPPGGMPPAPAHPPPAGTPLMALLGMGASPIPSGDLDRFIADNRLDQGAVISLRAESREVQDKVIAMGPLVNAVNPSAALMGRIRSTRLGVLNYMGGLAGPGGGPAPVVGHWPGGQQQLQLPALPAPQACSAPPLSDAVTEALRATPMGAEGGRIEDSRLNQEALRAIQSLTTGGAGGGYGGGCGGGGGYPGAAPEGQNGGGFGGGGGGGARVEDYRLNEEAMKAIHAINAADL